jgi:hypothetical protein
MAHHLSASVVNPDVSWLEDVPNNTIRGKAISSTAGQAATVKTCCAMTWDMQQALAPTRSDWLRLPNLLDEVICLQ